MAILFTPQTADQVKLAIEGWEASNFYALLDVLLDFLKA
jgi:AAT family amino acid transporter